MCCQWAHDTMDVCTLPKPFASSLAMVGSLDRSNNDCQQQRLIGIADCVVCAIGDTMGISSRNSVSAACAWEAGAQMKRLSVLAI